MAEEPKNYALPPTPYLFNKQTIPHFLEHTEHNLTTISILFFYTTNKILDATCIFSSAISKVNLLVWFNLFKG